MDQSGLSPWLALHHLEAIVAVADTGNLTRADELLFIIPSAICHQLGLIQGVAINPILPFDCSLFDFRTIRQN